MAGFRAAPFALIAEGQSLNFSPSSSDNYPIRVVAGLSSYRFSSPINTALANTGWFSLEPTLDDRVTPYVNAGLETFGLLCGGSTDINLSYTAQNIYDKMCDISDTLKAAGINRVVALTIPPSTLITSNETKRTDTNALIVADASLAFDGVANVAVISGLDDATNVTYYSDGTHWTATAAQLAADAVVAVLTEILDSTYSDTYSDVY